MNAADLTRTLLLTAVDLTRACAVQEHYCEWLALHSDTLGGSAGIAHYFGSVALAFEEAIRSQPFGASDAFIARETLSDILMASAPLSAAELRDAVKTALREAGEEDISPFVLPPNGSNRKQTAPGKLRSLR